MSRVAFTGPRLPKAMLEKVHDGRTSKGHQGAQPRRAHRTGERQQRQTHWSGKQIPIRKFGAHTRVSRDDAKEIGRLDSDSDSGLDPKIKASNTLIRGAKSRERTPSSPEDDEDNVREPAPTVSKAVRARLEEDDAEIAALEKKLGIKGKKLSKTADDGLDWLGSDSGSERNDAMRSSKRKRPDDERWLEDKRRRAQRISHGETPSESRTNRVSGEENEESDLEGLENPFSEDETSDDEFEGLDSDDLDAAQTPVTRKRENPYVAPIVEGTQPAKYIPPSLRTAPSSDEEALKRLRRQLQGLLNRLSEANILSILQSVELIYIENARQYVTSTLVDMLAGLVSDPAVLNDTFLVLHAGFAAALYRVVGTDFGAQLLEGLVQAFDRFRADGSTEGKQMLNLMAFMANLYSLQVIGSEVMFDYIRLLLTELSETNTELLLRVIRISGTQLRHDDPTSLKDIVLLLQRLVVKAGEGSLSIRTKFMIETIQDLKNNRMKTGASASALAMEQMQRMKKTLGTLSNRTKANEPLRITLADIRDTEKKGKWWLIGASYKDPTKMAGNGTGSVDHRKRREESGDDSEASEDVDLDRLARAQGMNTDVRRAIFISVAGAVDHKHAYMRLMKLNLRNKQLIEIPRVLLHCVGAETAYNPYYTIIAREFCGDHKLRKAYQFVLLDIFRRMGERNGSESDDDFLNNDMPVTKIYNLAKMFATLIADGLIRIAILKPLDLANLQPKTQIFVEVLLVTIMTLLRKKGRDTFETSVKDVFRHATAGMVTGLRYYLSTVLASTEIASKKEKKIVVRGCEYANVTLLETPTALDDESSGDDGDMY